MAFLLPAPPKQTRIHRDSKEP